MDESRGPAAPGEPGHAAEWDDERFTPGVGGTVTAYEHYHRYLVARALTAGKDVVDLASGEGYGAGMLAASARTVTGVDIDPDAVRRASERYTAANLEFIESDIGAVDLPAGVADVVCCFEAMEHVSRPERVVDEARRLLRPGGLFLASTPNSLAAELHGVDLRNAHHEEEFSVPEFAAILKSGFDWIQLSGQRVVAGSLIWSLDDANGHSATVIGIEGHAGGSFVPAINEYTIAVCGTGDEPDTRVLPQSVAIDPACALVNEHESLWREGQAVAAELQRLLRIEAEAREYWRLLEAREHELMTTRDALADVTAEASRLREELAKIAIRND